MDLQKVPEISVLVDPAQRKQPADPGPVFMNTAASFRIQERASFPISLHLQIRQNHTVHNIQLYLTVQQRFKIFPGCLAQPENIQQIQCDGTAHPRAA